MNRDERGDDPQPEPQPRPAPGIEGPIRRERTSPAEFLREVRGEMKKVAWPTRQEVINYSIVVLVVTILLTLMVGGLDWVFRRATINLFG